jgi:hypothetical protein
VFTQLIGLLVLHLSGRLKLGPFTPVVLLDQFFNNQRTGEKEAEGPGRNGREQQP